MTTKTVIPDSITMTREYFKQVLKRHNRASKIGFSKKHTADILKVRGTEPHNMPDKVYSLPVEWHTNESYVITHI